MKTTFFIFLLFAAFLILSAYSCEKEEVKPVVDTPRSAVPESLSNTWMESWSLYNQYNFDPLLYNPEAGVWFRGSHDPWSMDPRPGSGLLIEPDGDFVWAIVVDAGSGGCRSYTAEYLTGTVVVKDQTITFHPTIRRRKYHSVCQPENSFDIGESTSSFSLRYSLSEDSNYSGQDFDVLTLVNPDQSQITFSQLKGF